MKKMVFVLAMVGLICNVCYGAWDNTTSLQTLAPAAAFQQVQDNFTALTGGGVTGGIVLPSGAVFYMITGDCPTGTTDVTATYSDKFIKINATQATTSGVILTGTTDSHTLSVAEMPAHSHYDAASGSPTGGGGYLANAHAGSSADASTSSVGGGGGHTHTISSATTLEPASVTCKLCQVD